VLKKRFLTNKQDAEPIVELFSKFERPKAKKFTPPPR